MSSLFVFLTHFSSEEAPGHHRCQRRHAGDEGGEPADDEREEGDHRRAFPLAAVPTTSSRCCHPPAFPAAVWHQCCEF